MKTKHALLICIGTGALSWSNLALAQAPADGEAAADDDTIIVTALKRAESLQEVAVSMLVFDGDKLSDSSIYDIKELSAQIPGINYIESPTVPAVQMRGFGSPSNNPASDQTVAVYNDGVSLGRARLFQAPFFDTARIEVLRGPQGALLGKNTAAGALSIVSAAPTDTLDAGVSATYLFERDGIDANAFVSGPLSDSVSARFAVHYYNTTKGYLYNSGNLQFDPRENIFSGRLSLDFHPSDSFEMATRFEYTDLVYRGTPAANFPGTVPIEDILVYRRNMPGVFGVEDGLKLKPYQFSNTATLDLGNLTLVSVSGYAGYKGTSVGGGGANNPEVFGTTLIEKYKQASQEFRLVSEQGGRFEWIAGLYGELADYHSENIPRYNLLGGLVNGQGHTYYDESGKTFSAYATGTFKVADSLRLIGGLRFTHIRKHATFVVRQDFGPAFGYVPGLTRDQRISENHLDPSATIEFDATPDVMLYASYQRGSKAGTFQSTNRTVAVNRFALLPEKSEAFEAGVKSQFGSWLTMNVAAFQLTFSNLQSSQYVGTPPTLTVVNVGKARSRGIEYTVTARVAKELSFSASGSYIDAKFLDYAGAPCTFAQLAAGCVNGTINAAGRKLSGTPKWAGSVSADYRGALNDDLDLFVSTSLDYRSSRNIDANVQNPFYGSQGAFAKLNGRVGIGSPDERWSVALVGRNILNRKTINSSIAWGPPFVSSQTVAVRIDPSRSIGLQFKLGF
jgi:iron complex outermembrane recepter protein